MAKRLLWIFVVGNFLINLIFIIIDLKEYLDVMPMWIAIGVIAICESIEQLSEKKN